MDSHSSRREEALTLFQQARARTMVLASLSLVIPLVAIAKAPSSAPLKELRFELGTTTNQPVRIRGAGVKQQLLVTGVAESGALRDITREVRYQISPSSIARVDTNGLLFPLSDG